MPTKILVCGSDISIRVQDSNKDSTCKRTFARNGQALTKKGSTDITTCEEISRHGHRGGKSEL